jgi:hypothetical protein
MLRSYLDGLQLGSGQIYPSIGQQAVPLNTLLANPTNAVHMNDLQPQEREQVKLSGDSGYGVRHVPDATLEAPNGRVNQVTTRAKELA